MKRKKQTITTAEYRQLITEHRRRGNRKVINALKCERDGVKFASRLERDMYGLLEMLHIPFEFQKKYIVQEGFRYNDDAVRPITFTVDFYLPEHDKIIDTKGVHTQQGDMRIKMLKKRFADAGIYTEILLPATLAECQRIVYGLIGINGK